MSIAWGGVHVELQPQPERSGDQNFKIILSHSASSKPPWGSQSPISKTNKQTKQNKTTEARVCGGEEFLKDIFPYLEHLQEGIKLVYLSM